ncbi:MAG: Stp1/IreP family PP2C-type Ser/Thr phosphatase, partial [Caldisericia bacterium]|nr:Stp1/IreP family PP2C-type Ser/Thr phosphatase [Caldisericia bacterium]
MPKTLVKKRGIILKTTYFVKTDIGRQREKNEDAYLVHVPKSRTKKEIYGSLYAVADGVGGYSRGDYASKLALKIINDTYYSQSSDIDPILRLKNAILRANEIIYQENLKNSEKNRMSTTIVVAIIIGKKAIIANVGDSRAYLINKKTIRQITRDHSLVDEQVRAGIITKEEAKRSRYKNIITRSIGSERDVEIDFYTIELKNGDIILLTTDGLTRVVDDLEIYKKTIFNSPKKAVESLIDLANKRGGPDNITVCLVKIGSSNSLFLLIPSLLILLTLLFIFLFKPSIFGIKTGTLSIDSE